jgi:hypothetical protein
VACSRVKFTFTFTFTIKQFEIVVNIQTALKAERPQSLTAFVLLKIHIQADTDLEKYRLDNLEFSQLIALAQYACR